MCNEKVSPRSGEFGRIYGTLNLVDFYTKIDCDMGSLSATLLGVLFVVEIPNCSHLRAIPCRCATKGFRNGRMNFDQFMVVLTLSILGSTLVRNT